MIEFAYKPGAWWLLATAVLIVGVVLWSNATAIGRPKGRLQMALALLRVIALVAVGCCLLDPQWVQRIEHKPPARMAVLLDSSRSMAIRDVPRDRLDQAKTWLRNSLLPNTPPNVSVSYFSFDQNCSPLWSGRPAATPFEMASPTGTVTSMANCLDQLLASSAPEPLIGVLLCSDGIETDGQDPTTVARHFRRKGIPIHTVTFGTTNEPHDIAIENVQVKRAVVNQARSQVRVTLRSSGYEGKTVPLQLRFNRQVIAQASVRLNGGSQDAELDFSPQIKGYHVFEAAVPVQPDEWLSSNNRRPFGLEIIDPTIRVLYMEGTPTQARQPEWKYLKDALESDPGIKCKAMFRWPDSQGYSLSIVDIDPDTGERVYPVQHPTQGFPRSLTQLLEYDVVINSDIPKESFSAQQLLNTAKLVEEYGGGFVMIGGKKAFGAGGYHRTVLDKFIPVAMENDSDTSYATFRLRVLQSALNHPLIAFGVNQAETIDIWTKKFPLLYGYNRVGRAKPGAFALAVDTNERTAYGPRIILAAQEIGKGRTMAFTSDTTRSWGKDFETVWGERISGNGPLNEMNCDCRYFRRFWINAIRWLAAGKAGNTNGPVTLELAQTVCRPGETIGANVRVLGTDMKETAGADVAVHLAMGNQTVRSFIAKFDPTARLYRASVVPPSAADFTITATASLHKTSLGKDMQLLVCEDSDPEMERIRANPELMAEIARVSDGKTFLSDKTHASALKAIFGNAPPVSVEMRRTSLWDRATWLTLITLLLAAEWILRRVRGLA